MHGFHPVHGGCVLSDDKSGKVQEDAMKIETCHLRGGIPSRITNPPQPYRDTYQYGRLGLAGFWFPSCDRCF